MQAPPMIFTWDGEAMVPRHPAHADKVYVVGEVYRLEVREERSQASHNHFFAAVHDAWLNLPDHLAMEFTTPEKLRKRALIDAGFYDERRLIASSPAEARKIAAFLKPTDDLALISVAGNVVIERKAKSQSVRAMGKKVFQESKDAVLGVLANMLGTDTETLQREAGAAA